MAVRAIVAIGHDRFIRVAVAVRHAGLICPAQQVSESCVQQNLHVLLLVIKPKDPESRPCGFRSGCSRYPGSKPHYAPSFSVQGQHLHGSTGRSAEPSFEPFPSFPTPVDHLAGGGPGADALCGLLGCILPMGKNDCNTHR